MNNLYEYQLKYLIRGHSIGGNLNDKSTRVEDASFEPLPSQSTLTVDDIPMFTNICATCGQNIINLIDTDTGKIVKRFNDDMFLNKTKEIYHSLDWTIINDSSVLAAGGEHGQIKIILPKTSSCVARIDAHQRPIRCLKFDYKHREILFSASDDHKIKIWKLDLKNENSGIDCECTNELIGTIEYNQLSKSPERVLSMTFISSRYMVITTELDIYHVKINTKKLLRFKDKKNTSILAENQRENSITNENAIQYMTTSEIDNKKEMTQTAERICLLGVDASKNFVANSLFYFGNLLYFNLVNSNVINVMEIVFDDDSTETEASNDDQKAGIRLKLVSAFSLCDEKSVLDTRANFFLENESVFILKASTDGRFYCGQMDSTGRKCLLKFKYELPNDYVIKPVNTSAKTEVKNYDLFEKPTILQLASNTNSIVSITNQNIIAIFNKFKNIQLQVECAKLSVQN